MLPALHARQSTHAMSDATRSRPVRYSMRVIASAHDPASEGFARYQQDPPHSPCHAGVLALVCLFVALMTGCSADREVGRSRQGASAPRSANGLPPSRQIQGSHDSEREDVSLHSSPWQREGLDFLEPIPLVDWPTEHVHITSYFGWHLDPMGGRGSRMHRGTDFRGETGDLVMAIAPGVVHFVGHDPSLGKLVIVDHGEGIQSTYGHLSDHLVVNGQSIDRGGAIGLLGNTGRSHRAHLHLAVKIDNVAIDPLMFIGHPMHRLPAFTMQPPPRTSSQTAITPVSH